MCESVRFSHLTNFTCLIVTKFRFDSRSNVKQKTSEVEREFNKNSLEIIKHNKVSMTDDVFKK